MWRAAILLLVAAAACAQVLRQHPVRPMGVGGLSTDYCSVHRTVFAESRYGNESFGRGPYPVDPWNQNYIGYKYDIRDFETPGEIACAPCLFVQRQVDSTRLSYNTHFDYFAEMTYLTSNHPQQDSPFRNNPENEARNREFLEYYDLYGGRVDATRMCFDDVDLPHIDPAPVPIRFQSTRGDRHNWGPYWNDSSLVFKPTGGGLSASNVTWPGLALNDWAYLQNQKVDDDEAFLPTGQLEFLSVYGWEAQCRFSESDFTAGGPCADERACPMCYTAANAAVKFQGSEAPYGVTCWVYGCRTKHKTQVTAPDNALVQSSFRSTALQNSVFNNLPIPGTATESVNLVCTPITLDGTEPGSRRRMLVPSLCSNRGSRAAMKADPPVYEGNSVFLADATSDVARYFASRLGGCDANEAACTPVFEVLPQFASMLQKQRRCQTFFGRTTCYYSVEELEREEPYLFAYQINITENDLFFTNYTGGLLLHSFQQTVPEPPVWEVAPFCYARATNHNFRPDHSSTAGTTCGRNKAGDRRCLPAGHCVNNQGSCWGSCPDCQNGGTCTSSGHCECPLGYGGDDCSVNIGTDLRTLTCADYNPCPYRGRCVDEYVPLNAQHGDTIEEARANSSFALFVQEALGFATVQEVATHRFPVCECFDGWTGNVWQWQWYGREHTCDGSDRLWTNDIEDVLKQAMLHQCMWYVGPPNPTNYQTLTYNDGDPVSVDTFDTGVQLYPVFNTEFYHFGCRDDRINDSGNWTCVNDNEPCLFNGTTGCFPCPPCNADGGFCEQVAPLSANSTRCACFDNWTGDYCQLRVHPQAANCTRPCCEDRGWGRPGVNSIDVEVGISGTNSVFLPSLEASSAEEATFNARRYYTKQTVTGSSLDPTQFTSFCECVQGFGGSSCEIPLCPLGQVPSTNDTHQMVDCGYGDCVPEGLTYTCGDALFDSCTFTAVPARYDNISSGACACINNWSPDAENDGKCRTQECVRNPKTAERCSGLRTPDLFGVPQRDISVCGSAKGDAHVCECWTAALPAADLSFGQAVADGTIYHPSIAANPELVFTLYCDPDEQDATPYCVEPGETAVCSGRGKCYRCTDPQRGTGCPPSLNATAFGGQGLPPQVGPPKCHCQDGFTGQFCELSACGSVAAGTECSKMVNGTLEVRGTCKRLCRGEGDREAFCGPNTNSNEHTQSFACDCTDNEIGGVYGGSQCQYNFTGCVGANGLECSGHGNCVGSNGTHVLDEHVYECQCQEFYSGEFCETVDNCPSCELGQGDCVETAEGSGVYECQCRTVYSGTNCDIDACALYGGNATSAYFCECPEGSRWYPTEGFDDTPEFDAAFPKGCRKECTTNSTGYECGLPSFLGRTRCSPIVPANSSTEVTCDCAEGFVDPLWPGPLSVAEEAANGTCVRKCTNCANDAEGDCDLTDCLGGSPCQWTGDTCSTPFCSNGGNRTDDGCECGWRYTGTFCEIDKCNTTHSEGAVVTVNTTFAFACACQYPFQPDFNLQSATYGECVSACGDNGSPSGCVCVCDDVYTGRFCNQALCERGTASGDGTTCNCFATAPVVAGTYCNETLCEYGTATADFGACVCDTVWGGTYCNETLCGNNGAYNATADACDCDPGYHGTFCAHSACAPGLPIVDGSSFVCECGIGAYWNETARRCYPFLPPAAPIPTPSPSPAPAPSPATDPTHPNATCYNGGKPVFLKVNGTFQCACPTGYQGPQCENAACESKQFFNDTTQACECVRPWSGADCSVSNCPSDSVLTHNPDANNTQHSEWGCACTQRFFHISTRNWMARNYTCTIVCHGANTASSDGTTCTCLTGFHGASCMLNAPVVTTKLSIPVFAWVLIGLASAAAVALIGWGISHAVQRAKAAHQRQGGYRALQTREPE